MRKKMFILALVAVASVAPLVLGDSFNSKPTASPLPADKFSATSGVSMVNNKTMEGHPHGKPEIIIHFTENKPIVVDQDAIAPLLKLNETIGDYKIAVYSIVGAFRQGKSFLMDYCLRYLYAHYKSINFMENTCADPKRWMGGPDEPLKGFSWRSGKTATTSGIVIWSDIFLHENEDGEKTAIVIMDTQGLFDTQAKMKDSTKIFALNALFSSHLIFNMKSQIDEQQLQFLQMVSDYAKLIKETGEKEHKDYGHPFQNLLFLIRDWANYEDHPFGLTGGTEYVDSVLNPDGRYDELAATRKQIYSSFEHIKGFLMPYPGSKVAGARSYDGRWSQMDEQFKESLMELIEFLFESKNIQRKIIMGSTLTGIEYYTYLDAYCKIFASDEIPDLPDIYEATIDKHMAVHMNKAIEVYKNSMRQFETNFTLSTTDASHEAKIAREHTKHKQIAIDFFKSTKKMGTPQIEERYANELDGNIELYYQKWRTNILEIGKKFEEQARRAREEAERIRMQAEEERKRLEAIYDSKVGALNETLMNTTAEHMRQMELWEKKQNEFKQENAKLQEKIEDTVRNFNRTLDENRRNHENALRNLEEERDRERKERDQRDQENERKFNATIEMLKRQNLESSAIYNHTIERHMQQLAEEKKLREEQEELRKKERSELIQSQRDMEAKLLQQQETQRKSYEDQMNILQQRFEAEQKERLKQEEARREHDEKIQKEMTKMMETHSEQLKKALDDKEKGMEEIKKALEAKFNLERAETERQMERMRWGMMYRRNGSISIAPNSIFTCIISLLIAVKFSLGTFAKW